MARYIYLLAAFSVFAALGLAYPANAYMPADTMDNAQGNVPMLSGGIGDGEMDHIHSVQNQYDLKLLFTEGNGMYLSDVQVHIQNRKGQTVADTVTTGPVLLVNLPAGEYKVIATSSGEAHEQKISVGKGLKTYQFRYTTSDSE